MHMSLIFLIGFGFWLFLRFTDFRMIGISAFPVFRISGFPRFRFRCEPAFDRAEPVE